MDYQILQLENVSLQCAVKITCIASGNDPTGAVDSVKIKRRVNGTSTWGLIGTVDIGTISNLSFYCYDITCRSKMTYDYAAVPVYESVEGDYIISTIKCEFDGIYVGDATASYIAFLNPKYSFQKNIPVSYVTPFNSKYPYRIQNGAANYSTGSISGLFLPMSGCNFDLSNTSVYKDEVLEFLCNGRSKLVKCYDGKAWICGIDGNPKEEYSEFMDASEIQFNFTEIDDVPVVYTTFASTSLTDFDYGDFGKETSMLVHGTL